MRSFDPLPEDVVEVLVRNALAEDLGSRGDITTDAIIPADAKWKGVLVARQAGIVAGLDFAQMAFRLMDASVCFTPKKADGDAVKPGDVLAEVTGTARAILTGERVALNCLGHLSGIATATHQLVEVVKPHKARIACTRKTMPGLRAAEKYAVWAGGGINHRFGLYDAVLIKDNHIAAAGGLRAAVLKARKAVESEVKVQLEVDTLEQLQEALDLPIDAVLLDNMEPAMLKRAVEMVSGRFVTEASGGVTLANISAIAASGVDRIAVGWITHSAPVLDVGLDEG
ncbi:MAG: carboxylating nicotinate-nucleotide diphosphorylase [Alphaproteobacteria bacterium]|nr:carboxylating nicotinate-nucleotide diphosphorylase [Alphaproteobacteria bacterium]